MRKNRLSHIQSAYDRIKSALKLSDNITEFQRSTGTKWCGLHNPDPNDTIHHFEHKKLKFRFDIKEVFFEGKYLEPKFTLFDYSDKEYSRCEYLTVNENGLLELKEM